MLQKHTDRKPVSFQMSQFQIFYEPLDRFDYDDVLSLHQNSRVRKYLGGPDSKAVFGEKFESFLCLELPEIYWVVRRKENGSFIGVISITRYHDNVHYEVSYQVVPDYWGRGLGSEMLNYAIAYAFEELKLDMLYAETQVRNGASVCILEKAGMQLLTRLRRFGEEQVVYSINSNSAL